MTFAATIFTLSREMFPGPLGVSRFAKVMRWTDVFELSVDTRTKNGVNWTSDQ